MMSTKKKIAFVIIAILLGGGILDAIRYLKPNKEKKLHIQSQNSFPVSSIKELILVYNAWGGIYPGIADFVNKEFFPSSYPCNLCYQTFGTFSMKEEWKKYLTTLPYKKTELHKDNFQQMYEPENLALPVILVSDGSTVQVLVGAEELNQQKSLDDLKKIVYNKLKR